MDMAHSRVFVVGVQPFAVQALIAEMQKAALQAGFRSNGMATCTVFMAFVSNHASEENLIRAAGDLTTYGHEWMFWSEMDHHGLNGLSHWRDEEYLYSPRLP